MALLDLLASLMGTQQAQPDQQVASPVLAELPVTGPPRQTAGPPIQMEPPRNDAPMASPMDNIVMDKGVSQVASPHAVNYNNSSDVQAVHAANAQNPPQGGSANPGLYGILPQNLQHGTLRNVLGALGDAFLVGHGDAPQYAPRMQHQEIGDAMAGVDINDPASVQAAASRLAATGAPGAAEMADKLQQQAATIGLKNAQLQYTSDYHQQLIGNRRAQIASTMGPRIQGMFNGVTNADDYAAKYAIADRLARQVDPDGNAEQVFGLVPPDEWQPGMATGFGQTLNQYGVQNDREQAEVGRNNRAAARNDTSVQVARIGAGSRVQAAGVSAGRPSVAAMTEQIMAIPPNRRTSEQQAFIEKQTEPSRNQRRPTASAASPTRQFTSDGRPVVTGPDVQALRANPGARDKFDAFFGKGMAARILGR